MKITEYPSVTDLVDNNVFPLDGPAGTKIIAKSDLMYALFDSIPEMHSQIFRGKSLGSTFTSSQKEAISNGTFHDLWLGDYWTISGNTYQIVDFDYYYGDHGRGTLIHHVVVMPREVLDDTPTAFSTDNVSFAYSSSALRNSTALNNSKSIINSAFGSSNILTFKDNCIFAIRFVGTGDDSVYCDRDYIDMTIEIPAYYHLAGPGIYNVARSGSSPWMRQFALFRLTGLTHFKDEPNGIWLRDISNYTAASNTFKPLVLSGINVGETISPTSTSHPYRVLPYFCLRG